MAMPKIGCGLRKDRSGELCIALELSNMHSAVVAYDQTLQGALIRMKARIHCDQPAAGL